jgi:hypothetical protein
MITEQSMTSRKKAVDARLRLVAYIYAGLQSSMENFCDVDSRNRHSFSMVSEMVQSWLLAGFNLAHPYHFDGVISNLKSREKPATAKGTLRYFHVVDCYDIWEA